MLRRALLWLAGARLAACTLQIAIIMQGSNYINVSVVPDFGVNQFDLSDMYLSPCRAGKFSNDHSGVCRDCRVCGSQQYETLLQDHAGHLVR